MTKAENDCDEHKANKLMPWNIINMNSEVQ